MQALQPGATLGMIGGGQLGRYFVIAARRMGYNVAVLDPGEEAPAMQLATHKIVANYDDQNALQQLASIADAVTIEFENVPFDSVLWLADKVPVAPSPQCVRIAQDRRLEKAAALEHGLTPARYASIETAGEIADAVQITGFPAILKTATLGYDGKGQAVCHSEQEVAEAFTALRGVPCVLEQRVELLHEISVVLCRGRDGRTTCFDIAENVHVNGILDTSTVPASIPLDLATTARTQAIQLANGIDYVGVLGVEFFITNFGAVLFNEMAPRPHNSGHFTLDACVSCQFEQQLRMVCGLPAGNPELLTPVTMLNILGDSWSPQPPNWAKVLTDDGAKVHLYGKAEPRAGRKMGHINCLAESANASVTAAEQVRQALADST